MDLNVLNSWLLAAATAASAVVWWLFRSVHARVEKAETKLAEFELYCAKEYVTANSMRQTFDTLSDAIKAVFAKLERIEDKLDLKADKP
jgi:predicted neutral ceramidase superfamily lipid hydrolase